MNVVSSVTGMYYSDEHTTSSKYRGFCEVWSAGGGGQYMVHNKTVVSVQVIKLQCLSVSDGIAIRDNSKITKVCFV